MNRSKQKSGVNGMIQLFFLRKGERLDKDQEGDEKAFLWGGGGE